MGGLLETKEILHFLESTKNNVKKICVKLVETFKKVANNIHQGIGTKLDRDRLYETRWVWYHTLLAAELFIIIILLWTIVYKL